MRSQKIRDQVRKSSWQDKYVLARESLRKCIADNTFDNKLAENLSELFRIDDDDKKYKILKDDLEIKKDVVSLLDKMRKKGICILSQGAIEDYYPAEVPSNDSKPSRALTAISKISERQHALNISKPLTANRKTELEEIFDRIF